MATLVGRSAELPRLRALLDDAASGAVAALVGGDAGVGKSRLVSEVTKIAATRGFTVLCGQCAEIGDSVPYLPFADALRLPSVLPLELGPLAPSALAELLFSISDAPRQLSAATINRIVASAEGNAYY